MTASGDLDEPGLLLHVVTAGDAAGDPAGEELADSLAMLRDDLLELDVDAVEPLRDDRPPDSSKGVAADVAGWLAVQLGAAGLHSVVDLVVSWARRNNRTVEITLGGDVLKVSGIDRGQQAALIEEWLNRRHSPGQGSTAVSQGPPEDR